MFKENPHHLQNPLFSTITSLPNKQQERLKTSWADVFYQELFSQIEERDFEILYSDRPSRPNVPVNVLVGLEILKDGFGWTDEEMYDHFTYNVKVRYALGYRNLEEGHFELRTVYNFRNRLSNHMQQTGENLFEVCFEQITDKQLEAFKLKSGIQRVDSKQICSNIRQTTRLQLLIEVVQRTYRMLKAADKTSYHDVFKPYIEKKAGQYIYRLKGEKHQPQIEKIGGFMQQLVTELAAGYENDPAYAVLKRVFNEHFVIEEKETRAKEGGELSANSLQSPDDLEATFRKKRNEAHIGYVTNITETADPENELQLILKVQSEPNITDDASMLAATLPDLVERTELNTMYSDGGYNSVEVDNVCREQKVDLIQTAIRGGTPSDEYMNLADFQFEMDANGQPKQITCPDGQMVEVEAGRKEGRYKAVFEQSACAVCDLFAKCKMKMLKRQPKRVLYFTLAQVELARRRQRMLLEKQSGRNLRSAVEASVREISCRLGHGKLRVRGKFRVGMTMLASAAMTNARRIWRYQQAQARDARKQLAMQAGELAVQNEGNVPTSTRMGGKQGLTAYAKAQFLRFERRIFAVLRKKSLNKAYPEQETHFYSFLGLSH